MLHIVRTKARLGEVLSVDRFAKRQLRVEVRVGSESVADKGEGKGTGFWRGSLGGGVGLEFDLGQLIPRTWMSRRERFTLTGVRTKARLEYIGKLRPSTVL